MSNSLFQLDFGIIIFAVIIGLGVYLAIYIPYILNIKNTLEQIQPSNRSVKPGNAWLLLIPIFSLIYQFILYPKLSESIQRECESRNIPQPGDYVKNLGMALAILSLGGLLRYVNEAIGQIVGLGSLVVFIIYWVKIYNFKDLLRRTPQGENIIGGGSSDLLDN